MLNMSIIQFLSRVVIFFKVGEHAKNAELTSNCMKTYASGKVIKRSHMKFKLFLGIYMSKRHLKLDLQLGFTECR